VRVHDDPSREFDARNVRFLCKDCHVTAHNGSKPRFQRENEGTPPHRG
jgi:hypothetical protein